MQTELRFVLLLKPGQCRRPLRKDQRSENSWSTPEHQCTLSKKDVSSDELETLERSRNPTTVVTATGEVQTNEEARVYVYDLDLFVSVQLFEDTPAVLSLGKLCEEHGYTYEWASGQKPHLTKQGKKILFKTEKFIPLVVPGLSSNSGTSSSSTSLPQDSSSTSSSPATERSDDQAPGNWRDSPKTKTNFNKRDNNRPSGDRLRDFPEWLAEFTENLEDTEVPATSHISHDSGSERPTKVPSRKHIIFTHFPRDRIAKYACEPR